MVSKPSRNGIVGGEAHQKYRFTLLGEGLIRLEWSPDCTFEDRPSTFAKCRDQAVVPEYEVLESEKLLEIITKRFHLSYNKKEFSAHGLYALVFGFSRTLWRYQEVQPNLGGTYRTLDNVDGRIDRETGEAIELEDGIVSRRGYALLDDSKSTLFTREGFVSPRRDVEGTIDCYLFAYGHDYRAAIKAFYSISGSTPVLPRWTLGNWWSRYYAYSADSYLELMDRFAEERIPLSVAVLDMDWHLVDDPKVIEAGQTGWTGYTWNKTLFPDPPKFLAELHKRKLKVTLNDHPADGIHSYEDVYAEVSRFMGRDPSTKEPVAFDCVDQKYLKAYFDIVLASLEKDGCDFWWIDWQQGPYSLLKDVDPLWILNHYHFLHNQKVVAGSHPLIFSRYAGPGSHRYPVGFSGDTHTTWDSLAFQPEFTATASNIGYGWWSHDIGGHMLGVKNDDLMVRWIQFGVLSPIMRLHSTQNRWVAKEPWRLAGEARPVVSEFLRLRHRLIPYLHTMNHRAAVDGEPLVQPLYWEWPDHDQAYQFKNQYLFGSEILVIPITTPQDHGTGLGKVKGWLPPGRWVDFFTGLSYMGDRELWICRQLAQYPVFLREGSIVPLDGSTHPSNGGDDPETVELVVCAGADGAFDLLEEDHSDSQAKQHGQWNRTPVRYTQWTGTLEIGPIPGSLKRSWKILLLGFSQAKAHRTTIDGQPVQPTITQERNGTMITFGQSPTSQLVIELGSDPKPPAMPLLDVVEPVLEQAQVEYGMKDKIWDILTNSSMTLALKSASLQILDMNETLQSFLLERLSAHVK